MADTYDLLGAGVHAVRAITTKITVDILTFPVSFRAGRATPTNYYDIGLLRLGDHGRYRPAIAIDATSMIVDVPTGTDVLGYSLFGSAAIRVTEEP